MALGGLPGGPGDPGARAQKYKNHFVAGLSEVAQIPWASDPRRSDRSHEHARLDFDNARVCQLHPRFTWVYQRVLAHTVVYTRIHVYILYTLKHPNMLGSLSIAHCTLEYVVSGP